MKAIVVEIGSKYAVVMNPKGEFIRVKKANEMRVGYEIDVPARVMGFDFKSLPKIASAAAVLIVLLGTSLGAYTYYSPYSYVNVDINPSLEITLNMYNRVIEVKGLNDDGMMLLKNHEYKNSKIEDELKSILDTAVSQGYLVSPASNAILITVSSKNTDKAENILESLERQAEGTLEDKKIYTDIIADKVTLQRREEAKELGISPGKLVLIEKLKEVRPEIVVEDFRDKPVKEIVKSMIEEKKESKENKKNTNNITDVDQNGNTEEKNDSKNIMPIGSSDPQNDKDSTSDKENKNSKENSGSQINNNKSNDIKEKVNSPDKDSKNIKDIKDNKNDKSDEDVIGNQTYKRNEAQIGQKDIAPGKESETKNKEQKVDFKDSGENTEDKSLNIKSDAGKINKVDEKSTEQEQHKVESKEKITDEGTDKIKQDTQQEEESKKNSKDVNKNDSEVDKDIIENTDKDDNKNNEDMKSNSDPKDNNSNQSDNGKNKKE